MKKRFLLSMALLLLSGCSTFKVAPEVSSAIPVDQPLLPTVVYLPRCPVADKDESWFKSTFINSNEPAPNFCNNMVQWIGMEIRRASRGTDYLVKNTALKTGDEQVTFAPDREAEKSMNALYRIVLGEPRWSTNQTRQVNVFVSFKVYRVSDDKFLSTTSIMMYGPGTIAAAAQAFGHRFVDGMRGPRCRVYDPVGFEQVPACETFNLPIPGERHW
jgi:hypothetical protein